VSLKKGYSNLQIGAVGYVYPYDTKVANIILSKKRAQVILAKLKQLGLSGLFVARGGGRSLPAGNNSRRVELTITYDVKATTA
jgi:outer membrane protein OmpA-like peptidoglycan-associated protein